MYKEFEFFITEDDAHVMALAAKKSELGSILVPNTHAVISELDRRTQPNDTAFIGLYGAWLEVCVEKAVRRLLRPVGDSNEFEGRTVSGVLVDLQYCVAWCDRDLSIGDKRALLTGDLGRLAADPRLIILP